MRILIVSDLHFSHKTQDEYFFDVFETVATLAVEQAVDEIFVLGDLTTAKDGHCAKLVNRIVDGLVLWSNTVSKVRVLKGNHDFAADASWPFFSFLRHCPNLQYIAAPLQHDNLLFFPYSKDLASDLKKFSLEDKIVFAHVSVEGAIYESKVKSKEGIDPALFNKTALTISGDIHSRQEIGPVVYVGCPYNIRMNDTFQGGCMIVETDTAIYGWWNFHNFPKRATVEIADSEDLLLLLEDGTYKAKDQLKIRLHLNQRTMSQRRVIKEQVQGMCEIFGVVLAGFETPTDKLAPVPISQTKESRFSDYDSYCDNQKISKELRKVGADILAEVR